MLIIPKESRSEHRYWETSAFVKATPEAVFDYIDDHKRLTSHMNRSSWMMGGGKMKADVDEGRGQRVGSHIRLAGTILGIPLFVEEVVTERTRPSRKVWKTTGTPRLLVIGEYAMGFDVLPHRNGSVLRIFIDYKTLRSNPLLGWLKRVLARVYARWCVTKMVRDTVRHFLLSESSV